MTEVTLPRIDPTPEMMRYDFGLADVFGRGKYYAVEDVASARASDQQRIAELERACSIALKYKLPDQVRIDLRAALKGSR